MPEWLECVTALIRSSQLMVIAEGVETKHQASALRGAGIQAAQGFYFSRSLATEDFIAFHQAARTPR